MGWLNPTRLALPLLGSLAVLGCSSSGDDSTAGTLEPPSQPGPTLYEAGSNCASTEDCDVGLVCLVPASTCNALPVCVVPPPSPCDHPQSACSCLGEIIQVCDGYAANAVDTTSTCDGGTVILPSEAGSEASATPPADAGMDSSTDAAVVPDASEASVD